MADTDLALAEALALLEPGWRPPDTSVWMRRQRAELVDIEADDPGQPVVLDDDEEDDHTHD
jgi:hypothetical protein